MTMASKALRKIGFATDFTDDTEKGGGTMSYVWLLAFTLREIRAIRGKKSPLVSS
jgi:hypothetical protein